MPKERKYLRLRLLYGYHIYYNQSHQTCAGNIEVQVKPQNKVASPLKIAGMPKFDMCHWP